MPDNIVAPGTGKNISTEEVTTLNGGAVTAQHVQRVIPAVRTADGTAVDVTASNPLPVTGSLSLSGGATAANQATEIASLASIDTKTPALGQALAAASVPVVMTASQLSTITPPAAITGFLTEADFDTKAGSLTETAPATDTASSGLNGRLQRIAQRVTSAIAFFKAVDSVAGASDSGIPPVAVRDDAVSTLSEAEGDYVHFRSNARGAQWVALETRIASGIDSIDCVQSGTWTEANSAAIGALVTTIAASASVMDDWDNAASNGARVSGDTAHDAADAGEPVKVGGKAYSFDGTPPGTAVTEADRTNFITDEYGRQFVELCHPNHWSLFEDHTSAQTNNQLKAAPGSGLSLYITDIVISNGATAGSIKLVEDEGGTPAQITGTLYLAINGGAVINFRTPKKLTTNKSLGFTSTTLTTHSIEVHGFIAP